MVASWPGATPILWTQWGPALFILVGPSNPLFHSISVGTLHTSGLLVNSIPEGTSHPSGLLAYVLTRMEWSRGPIGWDSLARAAHPRGSSIPLPVFHWALAPQENPSCGLTTFRGWRPKGVGMHPPEWIGQEAWGSLQNGICQRPEGV